MSDLQNPVAEYQTDHDLLVVLSERVLALTRAVEKKSDDHELRLRTLEAAVDKAGSSAKTWRYIIGITLPIIVLMVAWLFSTVDGLTTTIDSRINKAITTQLTNYGLIKNK